MTGATEGEPAEGVYGLIVSGNGLVPYVDSAFRVEAGMSPVELVVSAGQYAMGKVTDDDCALCDFLGSSNDQEEETEETEETDSTSNQGGPDLVVEPPLMMSSSAFVSPGATFTLLVTVRNQGDSLATATTLRYYRSTDATISTRDTEVGTDAVDALAAAGTSAKFVRLTTPSSEGIYYYGACVASVAGESNTNNNCSSSRAVRVWSESSPVTIPDANLRAAIAAVLGKARGATITAAEIARMNRLVANNVGISDLTGLEFAVNLKWLYLSGNRITDISPLAGLTNLRRLYLSGNNISDVSALSGLTNLTELHLNDNPLNASSINDHIPVLQEREVTVQFDPPPETVTDDPPPETVTDDPPPETVTDDPLPVAIPDANLRAAIAAALGKASGATITKGAMSTLLRLKASDAGIRDLTGLEFATNLRELSLSDNLITDISALAGLTNLTHLYLWNNLITDISALAGLTNLTKLHLENNPLSASSINDHIPALQARGVTVTFTITYDPITYDPTPVTIHDAKLRAAIAETLGKASFATITKGRMSTLRILEASDAGIRDLTGLEFATNLKYLKLDGNTFRDGSALRGLTALSSLTNLEILGLSGNNISDLSPLRGLTNLENLDLDLNNISDLSPLRGLTNLIWLNLVFNNISDLSPLRGLTNLKGLRLLGNNISDLSPLRGLTNLTDLGFGDNNFSDSAISVISGLTNLTYLHLGYNNLSDSDISFLSDLTNLERLELQNNNISDISPLSGLTNLIWLRGSFNNISDISPLSGLTNLINLELSSNNISDVSPLRGLTSLKGLWLEGNNFSDLSPLRGLTNLRRLYLSGNNISDLSPLAGLNNLTELYIQRNLLSFSSINEHIPDLQVRGVTVFFDPSPLSGGDFNIEFVFLNQFNEAQKNTLRLVARQWMSVIAEDLPDYEFARGWSGRCGDHSYTIPAGERIDDLRIYVTSVDDGSGAVGWGSPRLLREETHLPVLGCMAFDLKRANLRITGLHEIGHVLGFGTVWSALGLLQNPNSDAHFNGPLAIAEFNDAGGRNYTGKKVPVEKTDGVHWRYSVLAGELMVPGGGGALSAITVQSLADLGYGVDVTQAAPFTLPDAAGKASAKIAAAIPPPPTQAGAYTLPSADPHGHGADRGGLPLIPEDDLLMGRLGLPTYAQPEFSCGTGQHQEPIYVVDPQGRIVRTISP